MVPAHEHEIEELLQSEPHETATDGQPSYSSLLQALWHDMQDSHAFLNTTMDAILDKTQQLHDLMARTHAQE
jgi:hypothetical protein